MTARQIPWADIHTLVFDFDGTLATCPYDFAHMRAAVLQVAEAYGLTPAILGRQGLLETIETGVCLLGEDAARAAYFRKAALQSLGEIEYEAAAETRLLPGVVDTLGELHAAGYRLGIITRNSTRAVQRILGETRLPVARILCREQVRRPKPHPEHVLRMLRLLGSDPAGALMVGDHPMDVETGKAAGMRTVAVLTGQSDEATLRAAEPDQLFPSVVEMAQCLLAARTYGAHKLPPPAVDLTQR